MKKLVILTILEGDFEKGFPVILRIKQDNASYETETQNTGKLPPAPHIPTLLRNWQETFYNKVNLECRGIKARTGITNSSSYDSARILVAHLNEWLNSADRDWQVIRDRLLRELSINDEIRVILQTRDVCLQRLPWQEWDLFSEHYPKAEIALSMPTYSASKAKLPSHHQSKVRILAIFGKSDNIDIETDRELLQSLPEANIVCLAEPSPQEFFHALRNEKGWHILFFAGHSSSQEDGQVGWFYINSADRLSIDELKYALSKAIAQGLKLAIFNSCDGLGLANQLAELNLPQMIVMREAVPDQVAKDFWRYFLIAFSRNKSFYSSVRETRECLAEIWDKKYPGASWLPIICQNPTVEPPTWDKLLGHKHGRRQLGELWQTESEISYNSYKEFKYRKLLLAEVKHEVEARLKNSLYEAVLINLHKDEQPQQVKRPWDAEIKVSKQTNQALPPETEIIDVFDQNDVAGRLLILGGPGAGKTTALLGLARQLINRAESNVDEPVPVLFNLSSWRYEKPIFIEWLITELQNKYGVRRNLGKNWLENQHLLLLLDGLDEVQSSYQEKCVQAINKFLASEYRPMHLVVCSRLVGYEFCKTKLRLNKAIYLQPLTENQVYDYLHHIGRLQLWQNYNKDNQFLECAKSPLFLSFINLLDKEKQPSQWGHLNLMEEYCQDLFDVYIKNMLQRQILSLSYHHKEKEPTSKQTLHWLAWLAKRLKQQESREFFIEEIQPSWLQTRGQKTAYYILYALITGLSLGTIIGLTFGLITGLTVGVVLALILGLVNYIDTKIVSAKNLKQYNKKRKNFLKYALGAGITIGFIKQLFSPLSHVELTGTYIWNQLATLAYGLIFGLRLGQKDSNNTERVEYPNQGVWESTKKATILGVIGGLLSQLIFGVIGSVPSGLVIGLIVTLISGLTCIKHFTLRLVLWWSGYIPWNYARFLDYATERMFLQRVGGSYLFIHNLLFEHFVTLRLKE